MAEKKIPRIVIAATQSGSGKTTIVTGVLFALAKLGYNVQSYKIGPDYIDPGYHELASGKPGHNLDTWLVPTEKINSIFYKTAQKSDIAIIEGVMGLYDGGRKGISSTAALAKQLQAPVVLVIDVKSMGDSAAAIALGFKLYDPDVDFAGVILNRLGSENHKRMITDALQRLDIPVLGAIYRKEDMKMPERHLGLTPIGETNAANTVQIIGETIAEQVDVKRLYEIAQKAPSLKEIENTVRSAPYSLRIAVAKDEAFSFYYPESLAVLERMGAQIIFFSPLQDKEIPPADGLIIGGGFPEMFVDQLIANSSMQQSLIQAAKQGLPIYAECGGFMYLTKEIIDFTGKSFAMLGLIPASCKMNDTLQTVGYIEAKALQDTMICEKNSILQGHEFHFSSMVLPENKIVDFPWAFEFTKTRNNMTYKSGYAKDNITGSYLHIHFAGNTKAAACFIKKCLDFKISRTHREVL